MDRTLHPLTVLAVTDVERCATFYEAVFGWTRRADFPIYVELETHDGRGVAFYERHGFGQNTGQVPEAVPAGALTGAELYLHCDDLEAVIARLTSVGAEVLRPRTRKPWGDEVAYFADPERNVLAVAKRSDDTR